MSCGKMLPQDSGCSGKPGSAVSFGDEKVAGSIQSPPTKSFSGFPALSSPPPWDPLGRAVRLLSLSR